MSTLGKSLKLEKNGSLWVNILDTKSVMFFFSETELKLMFISFFYIPYLFTHVYVDKIKIRIQIDTKFGGYSSSIFVCVYSRVLLPPANEVWGKVIFLHLSVILFTGG